MGADALPHLAAAPEKIGSGHKPARSRIARLIHRRYLDEDLFTAAA
jgi:hypothetical protein